MVVRDSCCFSRSRRNGVKYLASCKPVGMSRGSYAQMRGH